MSRQMDSVCLINRAHEISREIASLNGMIYTLSMSSRVREDIVDDKISAFQLMLERLYRELEQHERIMERAWSS